MRILLAENELRVRSAIKLTLMQEDDLNVVAEADSFRSFLAQMKQLHPDVVLFDWEMPGFRNPDMLLTMTYLHPETTVIVLSVRPEAREAAFLAGAKAFIWKGDAPDTLLNTIHEVTNQNDSRPEHRRRSVDSFSGPAPVIPVRQIIMAY